MKEQPTKERGFGWIRSLLVHLRRYLIAGIVVILPIAVTAWVLWSLFSFLDVLPRKIPGQPFAGIPGVGIVLFLSVIILVGIFATNLIGKRMISFGERIMARIPLANKIYTAVQQISTALLGQKRSIFSRVVIVEYPRKGIYSLGFVTSEAEGEIQQKTDQHVVCVFIPTTPNPTSGLLIFVPRNELLYLDMTSEDGLKLVISAGIVTPPYPHLRREPRVPDQSET
jgi:uncharacterized membrane protein